MARSHQLSLVEGFTENATLVTELIVGLRERGLDVTRPIHQRRGVDDLDLP
jgi:hypothetical protein